MPSSEIARDNTVEPLEPVEPDSNPTLGFLDELQGIGPSVAPFAAALPVWDFTAAVLESSRSGRVVALSDREVSE